MLSLEHAMGLHVDDTGARAEERLVQDGMGEQGYMYLRHDKTGASSLLYSQNVICSDESDEFTLAAHAEVADFHIFVQKDRLHMI